MQGRIAAEDRPVSAAVADRFDIDTRIAASVVGDFETHTV
jgi:hypothetical protein